jgi:hypothetical protein
MRPQFRPVECRTDGRDVARYRGPDPLGVLLYIWDSRDRVWVRGSRGPGWWDMAKSCPNPEEAPTC